MLRALPILLLLLAPLLGGWTQYATKEAHHCGLRWHDTTSKSLQIPISVDQGGLDGIAASALLSTVEKAATQWQSVTCPEGDPSGKPVSFSLPSKGLQAPSATGAVCIDPAGATTGCKAMGSNGNFIKAVHDPAEWVYGTSIFALTVLTFQQCTGEIVDADILLDDAHHDFCLDSCGLDQQNLCNTVTHEMGHLLGLDHSTASEATMYASASPGETKKCTLHGDDRQGVCAAYSSGCGRNFNCNTEPLPPTSSASTGDTSSGCAAGPSSGGAQSILGTFTILFAILRRRSCTSTSFTAPT